MKPWWFLGQPDFLKTFSQGTAPASLVGLQWEAPSPLWTDYPKLGNTVLGFKLDPGLETPALQPHAMRISRSRRLSESLWKFALCFLVVGSLVAFSRTCLSKQVIHLHCVHHLLPSSLPPQGVHFFIELTALSPGPAKTWHSSTYCWLIYGFVSEIVYNLLHVGFIVSDGLWCGFIGIYFWISQIIIKTLYHLINIYFPDTCSMTCKTPYLTICAVMTW